jgi:hypothetical protein
MAPNSLFPGFVKVEYSSVYAPHIMILPTRAYDKDNGTFPSWLDDTPLAVDDMVSDFVELFLPFFAAGVTFNNFTVYTMEDEDATPIPAYSALFTAGAGTAMTPGWDKATQWTVTLRTVNNNISKLVMLDAGSFDNFDVIKTLAGQADLEALTDMWSDENQAWSGRGNSRPSTFLQASKTLNDKLRRAYHMN